MDLTTFGFEIPIGSLGKFYFECTVKLNHDKEGKEVSYSGTVERINRLLSSIGYLADLNDDVLTIVGPKLQDLSTEEFILRNNSNTVIY